MKPESPQSLERGICCDTQHYIFLSVLLLFPFWQEQKNSFYMELLFLENPSPPNTKKTMRINLRVGTEREQSRHLN